MPTAAARIETLTGETASGGSVSSLTSSAASAVLSLLRRAPLYRPSLVLDLAPGARSGLREDSVSYWDVTEQWAAAAADRGLWGDAERLTVEAARRFPGSWRVQVIAAFVLEARGMWDGALKRYMRVVDKDPLKGFAYKRQIAILKAQRLLPEAIALLNYYLEHFSTDVEAWAELAALCLGEGRIDHALFAANEVLVQSVNGWAAHVVVGDILMTMGGFENCLSARRHYSASVAAKRGVNLRALYGMWLAAKALQDLDEWTGESYCDAARAGISTGSDDGDDNRYFGPKEKLEENERVICWARSAVLASYSSVGNGAGASKDGAAVGGASSHDCVAAAKVL